METARGGGAYCSQNPWYLQSHGQVPSAEVTRAAVTRVDVTGSDVPRVDRKSARPRQTSREPARVRKIEEPVFRFPVRD
jgi:hypothetical protein